MTGCNLPRPVSREVARAYADGLRARDPRRVVSLVHGDVPEAWALNDLWIKCLLKLNVSLPVLWSDPEAGEYGAVAWHE